MRAQEEEMRQNMEELEATQEEMTRKDLEMLSMLAVTNITLATIEFDMNGYILIANQAFLDLMGYEFSEIQGKYHKIDKSHTRIYQSQTTRNRSHCQQIRANTRRLRRCRSDDRQQRNGFIFQCRRLKNVGLSSQRDNRPKRKNAHGQRTLPTTRPIFTQLPKYRYCQSDWLWPKCRSSAQRQNPCANTTHPQRSQNL